MSASRPADTFLLVPGSQAFIISPDAIHILTKLSNGSNVGHVLNTYSCVLATMLDVGQLTHMVGTITGVPRSAPE